VFTYHTAGLRQSVAVSAGAIVVYAVWVAVLHRKKRREESSVG
jgi:ribulose kinase